MADQLQRAERFRALHEGPTFLIPNPWDAGSARVMAGLGFEALATTSSGMAFALGRSDGEASLDEVAAHVAALADAVDVPISVDLENGLGPALDDVARAIGSVAAAGAVGASIEDWDPSGRFYDIDEAAARVAAARRAADALDFPFTLTGRAENQIRGNPDLDDTIARLLAYQEAGADVLYAPGLASADEVRVVCEAVDRPVNVLGFAGLGGVAELAEAGATRISVGGALTWVAIEAMADVATAMLELGDLSGLRGGARVRGWLGA
jgi:2-methylisocitrate lyase-like PEP mutase family enzyme